MNARPYMADTWFALLKAACERESQRAIGIRLGVSDGTVSQLLNGTGLYGSGKAGVGRLAEKVMHALGDYECPYLTSVYSEPRVISSDECRAVAHGAPPIGSTGQLNHWKACNTCPHKALSAPPPPRQPKAKASKTDPTPNNSTSKDSTS